MEGRYQKSRFLDAGLVPSVICEGEYVLCLSPTFWFSGNLWLELLNHHIPAFMFKWCSSCVFMSKFPFSKDASNIVLGANPPPV